MKEQKAAAPWPGTVDGSRAGSFAEAPAALPPAAELGYEAVRAWLAGLAPDALAAALAEAERQLDGPPGPRADAALILAVARQMQGDGAGSAAAAASYFAAAADLPPAIMQATADRLLADTHRLYEQRRRDLADPVYQAAYRAGRREQIVLLRLIEVGVQRGETERLAPLVAEFEARFGAALPPAAAIALSRYHQLTGAKPRALRLLLGVPAYPAVDALVEATVLQRLIEIGAVEEAAARASLSAADPAPDLFRLRFRLAAHRGEAAALRAALADPAAESLRGQDLAEAMFRLTTAAGPLPSPAQGEALRALQEAAAARGLADAPAVIGRLHVLLHERRMEELAALFAALDGSPLAGDRDILLRRLEYHCHAGEPEAAERLYRERFAGGALNRREALLAMRLLSEVGRWEEAAEILRAHVAQGRGLGGAAHMAMRILRMAGAHEAVIAAAEASTGPREPELETFLARAREDLALRRMAAALDGGRPAGARSNWVIEGAAEEAEGQALFLCADRRYFLSLLTFLCSFLGQAPQAGGRILAFLDRDVPRAWHGAIAMVGARFGRAIELVPEPEFVPGAVAHREAYGLFTSGTRLSRAAYFRLYAARWLLARQGFRRAAYIDTDTICRADLSDLFRLEIGDAPIAAAPEEPSSDVARAAARNGLGAQGYFNSGVLLLNAEAPDLAARLEEAIRIAEHEPERLVFHDQCALNIAFQGRAAPLPARYNFGLRPSRERNGFLEDAAILHFLEKPKPWDVAFDRGWREEWRVWSLLLASILPHRLYVEIFAAANAD